MKRLALILATILLAASPAPGWLDAGGTPAGWNTMAAIPHAPAVRDLDLAPGGHCASSVRAPQFAEDRQVAAAGWHLWGAYQRYAGTAVVFGTADADGMCRPNSYQAFVFVGGRFAGTVAPHPMDARSDGAFGSITLLTATALAGAFERYSDADPLCCPHSMTAVYYQIHTVGGRAVVTVDSVSPQAPDASASGDAHHVR